MLKENPAFHYWLYLALFFFCKMYANSMLQGISRFKGNKFNYPEDNKTFGKGETSEVSSYANLEMRASRCWQNDLENVPIFLILSLGLVIMGASAKICLIYFASYAFVRIIHTVCLLKAAQPFRAIFFVMGIGLTIAVGVHGVYLTF